VTWVERESLALSQVQRAIATGPTVRAARALSLVGEHAGGWLLLGAAGAALSRDRRRDWLVAAGGVAAAHVAAVVVKRAVGRARPTHPDVRVLAGTPSALSFPSAHATSTTAAVIVYGGLTGRRLGPFVVLPMLVSRLVLGVHYPSDVIAGSLLGAAIGTAVRRWIGRGATRRSTGP